MATTDVTLRVTLIQTTGPHPSRQGTGKIQTSTILHTNDMHTSFIGMGPAAHYTPFALNDDATRGGVCASGGIDRKEKGSAQGTRSSAGCSTRATNAHDATVDPRWGKIGKQKIEDASELCPQRMETVDDEILAANLKFIDKARADGKPFFLWLNPTRMHTVTHLSDQYQKMRNLENNWTIHEAGMAQLDDIVGDVMKKLKDMGVDDNTIVMFTTDNGTEVFT